MRDPAVHDPARPATFFACPSVPVGMTEAEAADADRPAGEGWFAGLDPEEPAAAVARVRDGSADAPADWPS